MVYIWSRGGGPPLDLRSNFDLYIDSRGVKGFPQKITLVNVIPSSPEHLHCRSGSNLHRHQGGRHFLAPAVGQLDPWVAAGPNQGKYDGFDGFDGTAGKP